MSCIGLWDLIPGHLSSFPKDFCSLGYRGTMAGFLDSSPKSLKYEFWILKFFMGLNYSWLLVLSYGISHIHLKSCGLTQESAEDDPFSTFCLIWTNSISRKARKKIIIPKPGNFGIKTQLFLDQRGCGH